MADVTYYTGVGSRIIDDEAATFIVELSSYLNNLGMIMRSGDAPGADDKFQEGAGDLFETWVPWKTFAKGPDRSINTIEMFQEARKFLIESGIIPWFDAMSLPNQKFHARNYRQVVGKDSTNLSKICFFCSPVDSEDVPVGGTRTAVLVARYFGIPTYNLYTKEQRDMVREKFMVITNKKLIIFKSDWADEFDCEQFQIMTDEEYREWKARLDEIIEDGDHELYFGTNEFFDANDIKDSFRIKDISNDEARTIEKLLGKNFGTGIIDAIG